MANQTLYAVGVGDFIAYKGGQFYASGKFDTETNMEFTASYLDIRAGKRAPLVARYTHSPNATFSIIAANYAPEILKASMGGVDVQGRGLPKEESLTMATRTITLSETPKANGDIPATVWIKFNGDMLGALEATGRTVVIPNTGAYTNLPDNSTVCVTYVYGNLAAKTITMPAEVNPDILHIFVDIDLCTDKAGSGIVGRQVVEIPLGQLNPEQTINATMDGYSQSRLTGVMLADKTGNQNACGGNGVYAYITTEIFDAKWYDNVVRITNDIDDLTVANSSTANINLMALEKGGTYIFLDEDYYSDLTFEFDAGTATGTTFNSETGVITTGATGGTAYLTVSITGVTTVLAYTLEIKVE